MNKFSELISKGVAAFNYTPIANSIPCCPICREYNNIFSMATDTHMACLEDGRKVITGHIIANKDKFDFFIWSSQFAGVNFKHSGYLSFADWLYKHQLKGEYSFLNGDVVYIISDCAEMASEKVSSFTTETNHIPTPVRFLSKDADINDIMECICDNYQDTIKSLNESKNVYGNNWVVAYLSEGPCIVGNINGQNYKLS